MTDFIAVIDEALPGPLCDTLITAFDTSPHRVRGRAGGGVDIDKKHSTDLYLDSHEPYRALVQQVATVTATHVAEYFRQHHFALIAPLALRVADPATGQAVALTHDNFAKLGAPQVPELMQALYRLGPMQAQKYEAGQGHYGYWHCEVFPQAPNNEPLHRSLLFMYYLNDVAEGGQTEFFYQNRSIEPRRGRMVIAPAYFTHTHRGCVPVSNDKYILTSWVLMKRAEHLFGGG